MWTPELLLDGSLRWSKPYFSSDLAERLMHMDHIVGRYLVESRGDLLTVIKCTDPDSQPTQGFRMYKMVIKSDDGGTDTKIKS